MRTLDKSFRQNGFNFETIKRQGSVALLRKWMTDDDLGECSVSFEVVKIQRHNGYKLPNGMTAEAAEYMPKAEDWGKHGWTFMDRESAMVKFRKLTE